MTCAPGGRAAPPLAAGAAETTASAGVATVATVALVGLVVAAAAFAVATGCVAAAPAAGPAATGPITFEDDSKRALPRFVYEADLRRGKSIATMGGGVATGDYDGDSFPDLFFAGSVANGKKPEKGPCGALFRNRGDGTFDDATQRSGIRSCGWAMGAFFVDVDSDGRLDLLVTKSEGFELWHNRGDGTFEEVSARRGLAVTGWAVGLSAGDADGDGKVDLHVVRYLDTSFEKEKTLPQWEIRTPSQYACLLYTSDAADE